MRLLLISLLTLFSPYVFAYDKETFGLIIGIMGILSWLLYIALAIFIMAMLFKKWNQTNRVLKEINENIKKRQ